MSPQPIDVVGAIFEIFWWIGLIATLVFGVVWLIGLAIAGTWTRVHVFLEREQGHTVARWFDPAGHVGLAIVNPEDADVLAGASEADLFVRSGTHTRVRLAKNPLWMKPLVFGFAGCAALAAVAGIVSVILLIVEG